MLVRQPLACGVPVPLRDLKRPAVPKNVLACMSLLAGRESSWRNLPAKVLKSDFLLLELNL